MQDTVTCFLTNETKRPYYLCQRGVHTMLLERWGPECGVLFSAARARWSTNVVSRYVHHLVGCHSR